MNRQGQIRMQLSGQKATRQRSEALHMQMPQAGVAEHRCSDCIDRWEYLKRPAGGVAGWARAGVRVCRSALHMQY